MKIEAGASFSAGSVVDRMLFLSKGKISFEGKEYGLHSAFEFEANEGPVPLKAVEETEFFHTVCRRSTLDGVAGLFV